jgi:protein involved in polysaccharide export with SLBB domain
MARRVSTVLAIGVLALATGCHAIDFYTPSLQSPIPSKLEQPRELSMVSLPVYRIEPPDVIRIEAVKLVPKASYRISSLDVLLIRVLGTLPRQPIARQYPVQADGTVVLDAPYGTIRVEGFTVEEAEAELTRMLKMILAHPTVSIQLVRSAAAEQITGLYPVQSDGTVNLRTCGMVYLTGKTVTEAREAVQARLSQYFDSPLVGVEVMQFNSKSYFVIAESSTGNGAMHRFPITGNETVLDAIAQLERVGNITGKMVWVARPSPGNCSQDQILPVNWKEITHGGRIDTNYQLMPGDRVYIVEDRATAVDAFISKFATPIGRLLGLSYDATSGALNTETLGREYNRTGVLGF